MIISLKVLLSCNLFRYGNIVSAKPYFKPPFYPGNNVPFQRPAAVNNGYDLFFGFAVA